MSRLQGRLDRLERRVSTLAGPQHYDDRPTLDGYFNTLTTVQAREEFIALVRDVHTIQEREHEAVTAGQTIPPRSVAEQARVDELDRCVE